MVRLRSDLPAPKAKPNDHGLRTLSRSKLSTLSIMLTDKVALVTGSTSGIGLGIARSLASAGANVVLNGFGEPELIDQLLGEFRSKYKVKASYSAADMSKPGEIAAMVAQATQGLGGVDILVNNAGIQH